MSAISLKSITGITSITTPAGVDNQLTLHNNNTTEAVKLDIAGNLHFHNHLNITGVSTASNFKTGTSNLHNTGLNVQDLDVDGHTNLDNVSIAGVTTIGGAHQFFSKTVYGATSTNNFFRIKFEDVGGVMNDTGIGQHQSGSMGFNVLPSGHYAFNHGTSGQTMRLNAEGNLTLTSIDTTSSANPVLKLYRTSASAADADYIGQIKFAGLSDTGVERNYAKITGKILDASNGTEDGILEFAHIKAGSQTITGRWRSDSLQLLNSTNFSVAGTSEFTGAATFTGDLNIGSSVGRFDSSGIIKTAHGTESAPSHTFINDPDNGMYRPTTNTLGFVCGGDEKLRIDSAGRIGIGTATLDSSANVSITNASSSARIYMKSADNADCSIYFGSMNDAATGAIRYDHSDDSLRFYGYNNNEYARILGGALLVNRTAKYASSGEKLSVNGMTSIQGSSTSTAPLYVFNTESTADGTIQPFIFLHDGNGIRGGLGLQYSTSNFIINANNVIQFRTGSSGVGGTEKMRLTSAGQLVVGGTSSQASDAVTLMPDGEVTAAGFYFSNNIGSAMNACGIRRHTTNTMVFDTNSTERVRIDPDGNTSTKGSNLEHFVNKRVQSINSNGNSVQYVLIAPTGTNNLRLQGKFYFTRASGTSGIAQQTVEAQIMTNNTGGDAQYYVRTASTDQGSYSGMYYRWVTCDYNSTTYYALEGHPVTGSSYWGGFMQHGVYTGTANQCTNLGTVLNTTSHSISNISALTTRKAHERWYNTNLNVQMGALYVKQGSGLNGGYFAPLYYDVNGAALPTQVKVHGQKAVCIDCTRYYTSGDIITFRINNDYEGAIYVNPSGVQYNSTSDYRLKENVIDLTGAIDRVKQLKPKRFNFIKDPGNTMDGFMAHEVSSVVPNAVVGEKDAVKDILYEENDEDIPEGKKVGDVKEKDAIDPQSMDDSKLVPLLTAALQEAIAKIETLETKVAALEGS